MDYRGIIIEESLDNRSVLDMVKIEEVKIEKVTPHHKTPWLTKWTLDTVKISEEKAEIVAEKISKSLDRIHEWFADFKNEKYHYIIFKDKVFKVDLDNPVLYAKARQYGISVGIPEYQVDFVPEDKKWER